MRRILKGLLVFAIALICVIVVFVAALWWTPSLVLNERGVRWALRFAPAGTEVHWKSFAWSFSPAGIWGKTTDLEIHNLCFHYGGVKGCAPLVKVDASFTFAGFHPRLTRVGSFKLDVNDLTMKAAALVPSNAHPLPDLRLPLFAGIIPKELDLDQMGEVDLQVRQFKLLGSGDPLLANVRLHKQESLPGTAQFSLIGAAEQGSSLSLRLDGRGEILSHEQKFNWKGTANGVISVWRVALLFDGAWSDRIELHGEASAVSKGVRYASPLSLNWERNRIVLGVTSLSIDKLWPQKRLSLNDCRLESVLDQREGYPKKSELHCDLSLVALKRGALLPALTAKFAAELALSPALTDAFDVDFKLHELGTSDYLSSKIEAAASGRFLSRKGLPEGTPKLEFAINLKVPELQAWKRSLDHTLFSIPAPFRTLEGPATLKVSLERESREAITALAELGTDFHGGRQVFKTNHVAHVTLRNPWAENKSIEIDDRSELSDVALEAPPLKLEAPPQFLPDRRFEQTRKKVQAVLPKSSIPVHWKLALVTKSPFRIRTNLLESEVPVTLDLQFADNADMSGSVKVLEMPLQVFKKKAQVQHVNVSFRDGSRQGEVDGQVIYKNPEVTVQILLLGSTDKPRVEFVSSPPLSRSQIVSVLLFNKSVSELTDEEAASAGSLSQATADGALGLFSLLFLSSTPVESISYDPVSQNYAARVRLGDKTTLSIGSNFDRERQVALRRRLGGRWAIRTELHDEQGRPDVLLTLLEWFKRF
jgi:hypothetical protein